MASYTQEKRLLRNLCIQGLRDGSNDLNQRGLRVEVISYDDASAEIHLFGKSNPLPAKFNIKITRVT